MRLFRRQAAFPLLALFALVVQLTMSFGHVHVARASHVETALASRTFFPPPADHGCVPVKHNDCECPICWTISIAGSLVLPPPPEIAIAVSVSEPLGLSDARVAVRSIAAAAFDARGPPSLI